MFELLCCKGYRWKAFRRQLIVFLLIVILILWILSITTSSIEEVEVPPLLFAQNSQRDAFAEEEHPIIIIGAGAAGMMAAYTLKYMGIDNLLILDAHSDFGGRLREQPAGDFVDVPLDLGAEWIHVNPKILKDWLLFPTTSEGSSNVIAEQEGSDAAQVTEGLEPTKSLPKTITYDPHTWSTYPYDYLRRNNWMRFYYRDTKFYNSTWYGYFRDFLVEPFLLDHLQLNTVVTQVDARNANQIRVTTQDGTLYLASHVIMAVPISILQSSQIHVLPAPPKRKTKTWNKIELAPGLKVWIEFQERFYPDVTIPGTVFSYAHVDKEFFDAVWGKPSNRNLLALFEIGEEAWDHVELESDEAIIEALLEELDEIFDGQASENYLQHRVQNWYNEPYIQGAYSYNWEEYWDDIDKLVEPLADNRIYFCGEYLSQDYPASVHGAALSGRAIAQQLVQDYLRSR